jgi:negative regulator of sigma E activity
MTDKAIPAIGEQLSAWLDDELPAAEQELLLARLCLDTTESESRRRTLVRYTLIGDALRGSPVLVPSSLVARVREGIESSPHPESAPAAETVPAPARAQGASASRFAGTGSRRWLIPAGLAAAALVAAILLRFGTEPVVPPFQVRSAAPLVAESGVPVARRPAPPVTALSADRFTSYLVYHGEYTGMLSNRVVDSHIVAARPVLLTGSELAGQGGGGR